MSIKFTVQDHKTQTTFKGILEVCESKLPLDFVVGVFNHMRNNPPGFDDVWLQRALLTAKEVAQAQDLKPEYEALLYAIIMLMETGRTFNGSGHREASSAFALTFINTVAPKYFDDQEIQIICNCCRYTKPFRLGVDSHFVTLTDEVRLLTNVRFSDIDTAVVNFVKENKCPPLDVVGENAIDDWLNELSKGFDQLYGHEGEAWGELTNVTREAFGEYILSFKRQAANKIVIKSIINQNYQRIFSR